jgi:hypothetical protein
MLGRCPHLLIVLQGRGRLSDSSGGVMASVGVHHPTLHGNRANEQPKALLTLFPSTDCCENPKCDRTSELKGEAARQVLVYTINGAQPAYSVHLTCDSVFVLFKNIPSLTTTQDVDTATRTTMSSTMALATTAEASPTIYKSQSTSL